MRQRPSTAKLAMTLAISATNFNHLLNKCFRLKAPSSLPLVLKLLPANSLIFAL